jgi:DNA-binding beta-propeller fold protein YncE
MVSIDLLTDKVLWQKAFDSGCDRMAITPSGERIYLPSGHWTKTPYWYVVDALTGGVITKIDYGPSAHNTVCSLDGSRVYLESLEMKSLAVVNTSDNQIIGHVGPFSDIPRPFVINGSRSLCFASVNGLLGFEVADLATGNVIYRVEVHGFRTGPVRAHGCPTHGVGLTPDETELWAVDAANKCLHVFDVTLMPPKPLTDIKLNDQPTWISFTMDGRYAYPASGDVIDARSRQVVASLLDETGHRVESEKALEIVFSNGTPIQVGDQFGLGRTTTSPLRGQVLTTSPSGR